MSGETDACGRCGRTLTRERVYSVVDVVDGQGELHALLCRDCGTDLRGFLDAERVSVDRR
jgi:hypothetical protein